MPRPQSMALILLVFGLSGVSCRDSSENGGAGAVGGGAGGTTGNDGAGSDAGISLDGLSQALAAAHCAKIFECCTASEREKIPQLGGTVEACTSTTAGSVSALIAQVRSSISDGRIAYHGDRVGACVEATRTADCETLRRAISPDLDCTAALERAFEPLVRVGGACRRHNECIDGYCAGATSTSDGACAAKKPDDASCVNRAECVGGACEGSKCARAPSTTPTFCGSGS